MRRSRSGARSRWAAIIGVGIVLAGLGAGGVRLWSTRSPASEAVAPASPPATESVVRMDLATDLSADGLLGYGPERPIAAGADGVVTGLPRVGRVVGRGEELLRIDDQPVVVFYGSTPLFRPLDATGLVGRDVRTVADNLVAFGYDIGYQPVIGTAVRQPVDGDADPGTTDSAPDAATTAEASRSADPGAEAPPAAPDTYLDVRTGDAVLTDSLRAAIGRWQLATGADPNGVLAPGDVVVQRERLRVSSVTGNIGDPAGSVVIGATGTAKVVTTSLKAHQVESARGARSVAITLPSGRTIRGRVAGISRAAAVPEGQDPEPTSSVTIVAKRPAALRHLDAAPVSLTFTTEARHQVLAVPVACLLALAGGGYALQEPDGTLVPVQIGLVATGMVEVTGDALEEGMSVVTAS